MSLYKNILMSAIESFPDDMDLVCLDWHDNAEDGWPYNPPKPHTIGELRDLYHGVEEGDRLVITDIHCDNCKKADFVVEGNTVIMDIY